MSESVREYPRPFESIPPLEICECPRVFKSVKVSRTIRDYPAIWHRSRSASIWECPKVSQTVYPKLSNSEICKNETMVFLNNFIGDIDAKLLRTCCKILIRFWSAGSVCYSFKISMKYCKIWWQWWWWQWHQMIAWYPKKRLKMAPGGQSSHGTWLWRTKRLMIMARNNGRMTRGGQEGDPVTIMGFWLLLLLVGGRL